MRTRAPIGLLLAAAAALFCLRTSPARSAGAGECGGISFPRQVRAAGETPTLNGLGLRKATIFGIKVYVGALYLPHPKKTWFFARDRPPAAAGHVPVPESLRRHCGVVAANELGLMSAQIGRGGCWFRRGVLGR